MKIQVMAPHGLVNIYIYWFQFFIFISGHSAHSVLRRAASATSSAG